ncbi:MAG: GAF domain-containing protein [Chloroflexota bacterium]
MSQSDQWQTALADDNPETLVATLKTIAKEGKRTHTHLPIPLLTHDDEIVREQASTCLQTLILQIVPEKRPAHLLSLVNNAINAERGFVALADAEGFQTVASHNIKSEAITHQITQEILKSVREGKEQILTSNTLQDYWNASDAPPQPDTLRAVIVVPIIAGDDVISMIYSDTPLKLKAFSADDLALAQVIVKTVAPLLPPHLRSQLFS